jgi:hypothetical protein
MRWENHGLQRRSDLPFSRWGVQQCRMQLGVSHGRKILVITLEHADSFVAARDGLVARPLHARNHLRASTVSVRPTLSAVVAPARAAMARRMSATPA